MPPQQLAQSRYILGRFQAVKVVRRIAEHNSFRPQLLASLTIAHTGAPPIVALKKEQWTIKVQAAVWRRRHRAIPYLPEPSDHHALSLCFSLLCIFSLDIPQVFQSLFKQRLLSL